jgi:single-strand selective monofunctional uracil DNA glycosylase
MDIIAIAKQLAADVDALTFAPPTAYVYNPLDYAWAAHEQYLRKFGQGRREALLLGMNPGPFGMAQTGVPFGDPVLVRDWMGIEAPVGKPAHEHPKRPVLGFASPRREVSGMRLWGWARDRWGSPEAFFARCFVVNYCPLVFMEESGKNRTPDKLPAVESAALYAACDHALRAIVETMQPRVAIGIGSFAEARFTAALAGLDVQIDRLLHPSPASPQANAGWDKFADAKFAELGLL